MSTMFATVVQLTFFVFTVLCFGFVIHPLDVVSGSDVSQSSKQLTRTGNKPISAMDQILAINYNRTNVRSVENSERRGSVEESILNANDAQNVSRHLFEGDIVLDTTDDPEDLELATLQERSKNKSAPSTPNKRQASRNLKWLWHSKQVPYLISAALDPVKPTILKAIDTFNAKTCVKFVPKQGYQSNYVLFDMRQGCYSRIGKSYARPGPQIISIGKYCDYEKIIIHEILHAVGFYHEQSRPDRQNHIKILWENIRPGLEDQFLKYSHGDIDRFNINYNYRSIMHYGKNAFSKSPDLVTMMPIDKKVELGNIEMSPEDVMELDALYRCKTSQFNSWTAWSSFSPCDVNCYKNRQRFCYGKTPTSCGGKPNRYGIENEYKKCTAEECPAKIDGHWGAWSSWGTCSRKCNEGKQSRNRTCDNPEPKNKGKNCKNVPVDYRICVQPRCSLDEDDTDFRNGRLGIWQNDLYDTPGLNWQFGQGKTKTERTGPLADHTTTKDFYLFVESSNHPNNAIARLISKHLPKTGPRGKCLKFFYHMFGYTIGSLSVRLYPRGRPSKLLFFKKGEQGNDWKPAHVTLNTNVPYQLVFEAVIARPPYSDIAIDDVFIDNGDCGCQDKYMVCDKWKRGGLCKKSFDYMFMNCQRSCKFCGCKNTAKWNCNQWSMKDCKRNPLWMEVYCPVTCRVCGCYDKSIFCQFWKAMGECKRNPRYMKTFCRKSCKLCR